MAAAWTVRDVLAWTADHLTQSGSDTGRLDAEVLLTHALGLERIHLYTDPDRPLSGPERDAYRELVRARAAGTPVAHLIGEREFWSLPIRVTPDVLIPRPDTEILVEQTLARLPEETAGPVLELGTGSGCIAAALARERLALRVDATESSPEAAAVARDNMEQLGVADRVQVREGDWWEGAEKAAYTAVVANPPYVPADDPHLSHGDVAAEPRGALAAGPDGLDAYRAIIPAAPQYLAPGGWLLLEIGADQGETVSALLAEQGFESIAVHTDYGDRNRVVAGQWPS